MAYTKKHTVKGMMDILYSEDGPVLVKYMRENDSEGMRQRLLKTNRIKGLYCRYVCCRESVLLSMEGATGFPSYCAGLCTRWLDAYRNGDGEWDDPAPMHNYSIIPIGIITIEMEEAGLPAVFSKDVREWMKA